MIIIPTGLSVGLEARPVNEHIVQLNTNSKKRGIRASVSGLPWNRLTATFRSSSLITEA